MYGFSLERVHVLREYIGIGPLQYDGFGRQDKNVLHFFYAHAQEHLLPWPESPKNLRAVGVFNRFELIFQRQQKGKGASDRVNSVSKVVDRKILLNRRPLPA